MTEEMKEEPKSEITPIAPAEEQKKITEETPTIDQIKEENERLKADKKRLLDEHSSLGRKVKYIEEEFNNKYNTLARELETRRTVKTEELQEQQVDITDIISDPSKLDAHINNLTEKKLQEKERARTESERTKTEQFKTYEKKLYGQLYEFLKDDPDKDDIENELLSQKFNSSGNAEVDAERFFLKAQSNVLRKKLPQGKENKFAKNDKTTTLLGTGVGGNSNTAKRTPAMPELGETAKAYLKRIGKSEDSEFVTTALKEKGLL